jgi:predicted signal transduction protein with EAL and GGDEF domain
VAFSGTGALDTSGSGLFNPVRVGPPRTSPVRPPLDRLKIDKSFVSKLISDADDTAIVGATIALAKLLGLAVIAEGIEDGETADLLARKGCKEGQGYHFGKPMPVDEFERKFLAQDGGAFSQIGKATSAAA